MRHLAPAFKEAGNGVADISAVKLKVGTDGCNPQRRVKDDTPYFTGQRKDGCSARCERVVFSRTVNQAGTGSAPLKTGQITCRAVRCRNAGWCGLHVMDYYARQITRNGSLVEPMPVPR